jgi:hypothetical protein
VDEHRAEVRESRDVAARLVDPPAEDGHGRRRGREDEESGRARVVAQARVEEDDLKRNRREPEDSAHAHLPE